MYKRKLLFYALNLKHLLSLMKMIRSKNAAPSISRLLERTTLSYGNVLIYIFIYMLHFFLNNSIVGTYVKRYVSRVRSIT